MENENIVGQVNKQQDEAILNKRKINKKRQKRKLGWLFTLTGITALVLIVETYAWFIGTGSIETSEFEIGVSTEKSLFLSLDGVHWGDELSITEANVTASPDGESADDDNDHYAYVGHTNKWVGDAGLIPISTFGEMDTVANRMMLYGKSSLTATPGGFRLISRRIDNHSEAVGEDGEKTGELVTEQDGYVVFDLFIKNGEGTDYIPAYNEADDEAIYLTKSSSVTVVPEGASGEDYGLGNSVRIAFAQIGRIASYKYNPGDATSLVCEPAIEGETPVIGEATGLCTKTQTTIWEPNDTLHDAKLITHFNNVCKGRKVEDGKSTYGAEGVECETLQETESPVTTYVVKEEIGSEDNVDIYDGINGFKIEDEADYKLAKHTNTFTDSDKIKTAENRPAFFKLAANSITKIRVYIYLEGQDVDNYDLISLGSKIKINFGFTKDQFDLAEQEEEEKEVQS